MFAAPACAAPSEDGYAAFVGIWNRLKRVVKLEEREGGPPPLHEQIVRLRTEFVPVLTGRLKREFADWLDDAEVVAAEYEPKRYKTLKPLLAEVKKRRMAGTKQLFVASWMTLPEAKPMVGWIPGFIWDPLIRGAAERDLTDPEELFILMGWQIELRQQSYKDTPGRAELWWTLKKPPALERAEQVLQARAQSGREEALERKRWLIVRLRARNDQWIIERWEWMAR
jgi:hypothetical protein